MMNTQLTQPTSRKSRGWELGRTDYDWFQVFNRFFDDEFFQDLNIWNTDSYPVDQYWSDNGDLYIEVPLAGYKREDISLSLEDGYLVLHAKKQDKKADMRYVKEGIRKKEITRKWSVGNKFHVEQIDSKFEDGLLTVQLPAKVPDGNNIKNIEIK